MTQALTSEQVNEVMRSVYGPRPTLLYGKVVSALDRMFAGGGAFLLGMLDGTYSPPKPLPEDNPGTLTGPFHRWECASLQESDDIFEDYETSKGTCNCDLLERVSWRDFFRALDEVLDPGTTEWRELFALVDWRGI